MTVFRALPVAFAGLVIGLSGGALVALELIFLFGR